MRVMKLRNQFVICISYLLVFSLGFNSLAAMASTVSLESETPKNFLLDGKYTITFGSNNKLSVK
jgi:hypothetical protein